MSNEEGKRMSGPWKMYTVFPDGRIFKDGKKDQMRPYKKNNGYMCVCMRDIFGIRHHMLVHRVVAMTFLPDRGYGTQVDHINGNKEDNRLDNLRWVTHSENHLAYRKKLRDSGKAMTPDQLFAMQCFDDGRSIADMARQWEVSPQAVGRLLRRAFRNAGRQWVDMRNRKNG